MRGVAIYCYQSWNPCANTLPQIESNSTFLEGRKILPVFSHSKACCIFCHEGGKGSFARSICRQVAACAEKAFVLVIYCCQQCLERAFRLETCAVPLREVPLQVRGGGVSCAHLFNLFGASSFTGQRFLLPGRSQCDFKTTTKIDTKQTFLSNLWLNKNPINWQNGSISAVYKIFALFLPPHKSGIKRRIAPSLCRIYATWAVFIVAPKGLNRVMSLAQTIQKLVFLMSLSTVRRKTRSY